MTSSTNNVDVDVYVCVSVNSNLSFDTMNEEKVGLPIT